jgi:hypothetical protein
MNILAPKIVTLQMDPKKQNGDLLEHGSYVGFQVITLVVMKTTIF